MVKKTDDICLAVGKYEKDGENKTRWENVGSVMEKDDGGVFILLKRTFNPAGAPLTTDENGNLQNRDSVLLSIFPVDNN